MGQGKGMMKKGFGVIVVSGACAFALLAVPAVAKENGGRGQAIKAAVAACKEERKELGREAFAEKYGKPAMKSCVEETTEEARNAARECRAEREEMGVEAFREEYGTNENWRNAFGKCVSSKVDGEAEEEEPEESAGEQAA
jgi:hypothetical protein